MLNVVARSGSHTHETKRDTALEVGLGMGAGEVAVIVSIVAERDNVVSESIPNVADEDDPSSDPDEDPAKDPVSDSVPEVAEGLLTGAVREIKVCDAPPVVRVTATSTVKGTVVVSADIIVPSLAVSVQTASPPTKPHSTAPPKDEIAGMSMVSDIPPGPSTSVTVR